MEAGAGSRLGGMRTVLGSESVWGTRLRVAGPRYLAVGALGVLLLLGLRALLSPPGATTVVPQSGADAPSQDFALQFARAYLTYEAGRPQERTRALARFMPAGMDRDGGVFVSSGSQRVLWEEVASDQPAVINGRVITIAAGVSTQSEPLYLAVTVRHPSGGPVSLGGYPSFVGAPYVSREADSTSYDEVSEPAVSQVVTRVLQNYLVGSVVNLKADLTNDAVVTLPTVRLKLQSVDSIGWVGGRLSRSVVATVTAGDPSGASYTLTYELGLAYRERPYVDFVGVIPTGS